MNRQDTIAESVLATKQGMARWLAGFDDSNYMKQAPSLPNHIAWTLGHLAVTMHKAAGLVDPRHRLPDSDFIVGGTATGGGDSRRYASASVEPGSQPTADASQYPAYPRCVEIFNHACDALAAAVRAVPDASLDEIVEWHRAMQIQRGLLAARMGFHNGMHIGQIADLRRALGFKSVFS